MSQRTMKRRSASPNQAALPPFKLLCPIYTTDEPSEELRREHRGTRYQAAGNSQQSRNETLYAAQHHLSQLPNLPTHHNGAPAAATNPAVPNKKPRVAGGRAPVAKKVVVDMDSDDEIIWTMKNRGYKDREIQARLAAEGRTRYHPKTISTRFARQRRAMEAHVDAQLDSQRAEWHADEDTKLLQAHALASAQVAAETAAVQGKLWTYTAEALRAQLGQARFSARACRVRVEALEGMPEGDGAQETRQEERVRVRRERAEMRRAKRAAVLASRAEKAARRMEVARVRELAARRLVDIQAARRGEGLEGGRERESGRTTKAVGSGDNDVDNGRSGARTAGTATRPSNASATKEKNNQAKTSKRNGRKNTVTTAPANSSKPTRKKAALSTIHATDRSIAKPVSNSVSSVSALMAPPLWPNMQRTRRPG